MISAARGVRALPRPLRGSLIAALPVLMAISLSPAWAGYLLIDADGEQTLVSKGKIKELSEDGQGPQSAFDLVTARAWMANPDRRIYWEGTIEELCRTFRDTAASMAKAAEQKMDEQIARLPPEQRAKVEEMRRSLAEKREAERKKADKPGVIKLERTKETTSIAGQPTRKFRVLVDGKLYQENWLTTDPALSQEFVLDKAAAAMSRVSACAESGETSASHTQGVDEGEIYRELYLHGWPLKSVSYAGGKAAPRSEIRKVEKRDVADTAFEPPAGFSKAPLGKVMFGSAD
jgi:hypothetical protein